MRQENERERRIKENEAVSERKAREDEIRRMREQSERELNEKENAMRLMKEQKDREIADLKNKLAQASLMETPPQVNQNSFFNNSFKFNKDIS